MILQAAIEITCHDHSATAWIGHSYILILSLYLWFVFSLSGDSLAYGIASFSGDFHMWWYVYHYNLLLMGNIQRWPFAYMWRHLPTATPLPSPLTWSSISLIIHTLTLNLQVRPLPFGSRRSSTEDVIERGLWPFYQAPFNIGRHLLQLTASPWTTEASTRERWKFGALTNRKATSSNRDPSLASLYYYYVALSLR